MAKNRWLIFLTVVVTAAVTAVGTTIGLWQWGILVPVAPPSLMAPPAPDTLLRHEQLVPDVVEAAIPAVVSIVIVADVPIVERYYEEWLSPFGRWFGNFSVPRERQVGTQEREVGGGTGFFVSPDGYIVTNRHVVESTQARYEVLTDTGARLAATVVARDPQLDIAILKVEGTEPFPYLTFGNAESLRLGETVIAIGNALAEFPNSVSVGVVSGLARNITAFDSRAMPAELEGLIQTDAAVNRGNSGGPLLTLSGQVIGVNVAMAGNSENIGFALPAGMVENVFASVRDTGSIARPFLGVRHVVVNKQLAEESGLGINRGVLITRSARNENDAVMSGSPAAQAGLQENDIILSINGTPVGETRSLASVLRDYRVGDSITLEVWREGETFTTTVTLAAAPNQ